MTVTQGFVGLVRGLSSGLQGLGSRSSDCRFRVFGGLGFLEFSGLGLQIADCRFTVFWRFRFVKFSGLGFRGFRCYCTCKLLRAATPVSADGRLVWRQRPL